MFRVKVVKEVKMDVLPSGGIFRELQVVHDTGYFPTSDGQPSFEEDWHQVSGHTGHMLPGTSGHRANVSYSKYAVTAVSHKNPTSIIMQYVKHSN